MLGKFVHARLILVAMGLTGLLRGQVTIGPHGTAEVGDMVDIATTTYVFTEQGFGAGSVGLSLSSWTFLSGNWDGEDPRQVTPLLLQANGDNFYTVVGIGTTVVAVEETTYVQPFNVVAGSTLITNADFYFGWKDGTATSPGAGVISWDHNESGPNTAYAFTDNSDDPIAAGQSYEFGNTSLAERSYRFTATAIPEPSTYAMLFGLLALGAAGCRGYRRQKQDA